MKTNGTMVAVLVVAALAAPGCARGKKGVDSRALRSADEMLRDGMDLLEKRELRKARLLLQRVEYSARDRRETEPLVRLAIADATFYQGDDFSLIDARSLYLDFVTLYGDHPRAPYAQLQAGVCSLAQVNDPSRDQSQTRVAIDDLREVLRRYPASPYAAVAQLKIREAEALLAEHEYLIGRFYIKKKSYPAAVERLRGLLTEYPTFSGTDKVYYWIGEALFRQDNAEEGSLYLRKLVDDFPASEYAARAAARLGTAPADRAGASGAVAEARGAS